MTDTPLPLHHPFAAVKRDTKSSIPASWLKYMFVLMSLLLFSMYRYVIAVPLFYNEMASLVIKVL